MTQISLNTINEQLLKSIGVGIAIIRYRDLHFSFHNAAFAEWFGDPAESEISCSK